MTLKKKNRAWSLAKIISVVVCVATVFLALPIVEEHCVAAWHGCKRAAEPWAVLPGKIETMNQREESMSKDIAEIKLAIGLRGYTTNRAMEVSSQQEEEP